MAWCPFLDKILGAGGRDKLKINRKDAKDGKKNNN
jgi:hypothetical protein